jgi:hypothetical protein
MTPKGGPELVATGGPKPVAKRNCKAVGVLSVVRCVTELVPQVRVHRLDANLVGKAVAHCPGLVQKKGEPGHQAAGQDVMSDYDRLRF